MTKILKHKLGDELFIWRSRWEIKYDLFILTTKTKNYASIIYENDMFIIYMDKIKSTLIIWIK